MVARTVGLAFALALGVASVAAAETKRIDRTVPLSAGGTVALTAHNGWVQIRTWDRPDVEIHVQIEWLGLSTSSYRFRETTVDIDSSPDRVSIKWKAPEHDGWTLWSLFDGSFIGPSVRYNITAPKTARLDISTHNANTDIRDVTAAVHVGTHNGAVRAESLSGPLDLSMHNGWARVDFASFTQDSRITTHNGSVEVALPSASRFNLDASGDHLHVTSDFPVPMRAAYNWRRPDVSGSINGGGPNLRVVAHNGAVRLRSK